VIILDTNVVSELMRHEPSPAVLRWMAAQPLAALHVTALTPAEILLGIELLPEGRRRQQLAEQAEGLFAEDFAGRVLAFDGAAAPVYAAIVAGRSRAGQPIGAIDAMIAAIARVHGASVATRDGDLVGCGVPVIDPWTAAA
jgi:predicted nucleic acid-binding protein